MKTQKEAFIRGAEVLYDRLKACGADICDLSVDLNHINEDSSLPSVRWDMTLEGRGSNSIRVQYQPFRPIPPKGTPCLGWDEDKSKAIVCVSQGEMKRNRYMGGPEEDHLVVQTALGIVQVRYWTVLVEKEEK